MALIWREPKKHWYRLTLRARLERQDKAKFLAALLSFCLYARFWRLGSYYEEVWSWRVYRFPSYFQRVRRQPPQCASGRVPPFLRYNKYDFATALWLGFRSCGLSFDLQSVLHGTQRRRLQHSSQPYPRQWRRASAW